MELFIIFLIGILSGFLGATVGGGGLFVLPALMILGFPPQVAIATKKVGDIGVFLVAIKEYWRAKKIDLKFAVILAILSFIGSFIGAKIMINMQDIVLKRVFITIIILFLPSLYLNKDIGIKKRKEPGWKISLGLFLYITAMILSSIVGFGGLTMVIFIMIYLFGFRMLNAYATNAVASLIHTAVPVSVFFFYGLINIPIASLLFLGGMVGSFIGSRTALKKGDKWVKVLFTIIVVISVIKILFF